MLRVGMGSIAAGLAAFAAGFISYSWLAPDAGPASAGLRMEALDAAFSSTVRSKVVDVTGSVGAEQRDSFRARLASFDTSDVFALAADDPSEASSRGSSFGERFSFDLPSAPNRFSQPSQRLASFQDRFGGDDAFSPATPNATVQAAAPAARPTAPRVVAAAAAAPRVPARPVVAQAAPRKPSDGRFQLASADSTSVPLGYAPTDAVKSSLSVKDAAPKDNDPLADIDTSHTAIYDISARTVYMPSGRRLEAHSGLGDHMDDVRYVRERMTGPTPPNVYNLRMRESLFHGVKAIRLVPADESKMHGRAGILAHTYMLGPSGQSNGCVSFSDYPAFLDAFQRGEVTKLVVVERLANAPPPRTAADFFKDLFRGS